LVGGGGVRYEKKKHIADGRGMKILQQSNGGVPVNFKWTKGNYDVDSCLDM